MATQAEALWPYVDPRKRAADLQARYSFSPSVVCVFERLHDVREASLCYFVASAPSLASCASHLMQSPFS